MTGFNEELIFELFRQGRIFSSNSLNLEFFPQNVFLGLAGSVNWDVSSPSFDVLSVLFEGLQNSAPPFIKTFQANVPFLIPRKA